LAGIAVDGNRFHPQHGARTQQPLPQTLLKGLGVQTRQDPLDGIMRRNAMGQGQVPLEPVLVATAKGRNLFPVIRAADDRADGDGQDVQETMPLQVLAARVFESAKGNFSIPQGRLLARSQVRMARKGRWLNWYGFADGRLARGGPLTNQGGQAGDLA